MKLQPPCSMYLLYSEIGKLFLGDLVFTHLGAELHNQTIFLFMKYC